MKLSNKTLFLGLFERVRHDGGRHPYLFLISCKPSERKYLAQKSRTIKYMSKAKAKFVDNMLVNLGYVGVRSILPIFHPRSTVPQPIRQQVSNLFEILLQVIGRFIMLFMGKISTVQRIFEQLMLNTVMRKSQRTFTTSLLDHSVDEFRVS